MLRKNHSGSLLPSNLLAMLLFTGIIIFNFKPADSSSHTEKEISLTDGQEQVLTQQLNHQQNKNPTPNPSSRKPRRTLPPSILPPVPVRKEDIPKHSSYVRKGPNGKLEYVFPPTEPSFTNKSDIISAEETFFDSSTESMPDYPTDMINEYMKQNGEPFYEFFGSDSKHNSSAEQLNTRQGEMRREFLCRSDRRLINPKFGDTLNRTNVMIINTDEYKQGVFVDTCLKTGKVRSNRIECEQIFYYRRLVVFDDAKKKSVLENIKLPSGCLAWINC